MASKPRFRIPIHVFVYGVAFIPGTIYAYYWYKNAPTDEEFEKELQKNYSQNIKNSREKHESMTKFLQGIKEQNKDQELKMAEILRGGKGQQKRLHSVDEKIYGTEEGAELQSEAQESSHDNKSKKKKKRDAVAEGKSQNELVNEMTTMQQSSGDDRVKQSIVAMALVGTLAAGASLLFGGKRTQ
mmetsp:Transcript_17601/g.36666  ORF Transcript_17601/g.36666 Transcript_17601/m.36666 type:complete len:185 (-) Transcript_17601:101-655(-)